MTFPVPYGGITVTIERPVYNRYNDVESWSYFTIDNCIEYPSGSTEGSGNTGISDLRTLIVPPDADVKATDRVVLHARGSATPPGAVGTPERRAATYSVNGVPKDWIHVFTGWHPGKTVELQKVT